MGMAVFIDWKWNGLFGRVDSLEIQVDRRAGFDFLTIDTPNFSAPIPDLRNITLQRYEQPFWSQQRSIGVS